MGKVVAALAFVVSIGNAQYYPPTGSGGGGAPAGGAIGGAANCPAVNGVPYVTAAGVFTCDTSKISFNPTNGTLEIGPSSPLAFGQQLSISNDSFTYAQMLVGGHSINEIDFFSSGGTVASPTASNDGDAIVSLTFVGYGAANTIKVSSEILAYVFGQPSATAVPGRLQFDVAPASAAGNTGFSQLNLLGNGYSSIGPYHNPASDLTRIDSTLTIEDFDLNQVTTHIIRAGPNQAATDLTQWQDSSKGVLSAVDYLGNARFPRYSTVSNCSDSAGAAACGSAAAGSVVIDAGSTTVVVSTTALTANSQVNVMFDSSLGARLGVTCNTTAALPTVSARTDGVSFTIAVAVAPITNRACYSYSILN